MKDLQLLTRLSEVYGISGREKEVKKIMKEEFLKYVKEEDIKYDKLGSIMAKYGNGSGVRFAIAGHMDEIGMIVTKITEQGFLKFQTIGGWWSQVLSAHTMKVITSEGKAYTGVIGSIPPHILSPEALKNPVDVDTLYIDLGVNSKEEVEKLGVKVGDMICPDTKVEVMANGDFLMGKAWDNRIGCAIVLKVFEMLANDEEKCGNTVFGMGTVQEEVGCRGAQTVANIEEFDVGFGLDVTIAKDVPGTDGANAMGKGPAILLYDSGLIGHAGLREYALEIAKKYDIPVQVDYLKRGATDASKLSMAHSGSIAMSLCVPSRYIHSHSSMISYKDYENCSKLIYHIIKDMDVETFKKIAYE